MAVFQKPFEEIISDLILNKIDGKSFDNSIPPVSDVDFEKIYEVLFNTCFSNEDYESCPQRFSKCVLEMRKLFINPVINKFPSECAWFITPCVDVNPRFIDDMVYFAAKIFKRVDNPQDLVFTILDVINSTILCDPGLENSAYYYEKNDLLVFFETNQIRRFVDYYNQCCKN